ncbi:MAG: HAMP domain-containing histidine kinase [Alphaproteobacteria bacterium]|nr:MAG: HAMP domain-containing histidine kinase [Alphaproteobacteria bacterium]
MNQGFFDSLSLRVLVLTVAFVIVSEAIILVPSIARSYQLTLQQKIDGAFLASTFLNAPAGNKLNRPDLLKNLDVISISYSRYYGDQTVIGPPTPADYEIKLNDTPILELAKLAFHVLWDEESRIMRVSGSPSTDATIDIGIVVSEQEIRQPLAEYTNRNIQLSVNVALITAILVFAALQFYMVGPMQRITAAMTAFRLDPENPDKAIHPSNRQDEIGIAERELAHMQQGLRMALRQKARLAAMGAAVTKINHDLRNILSTAQLVSDRIAAIDDPNVQKLTPRLLSSIDRATDLCENTLQFAKEGIPQIERSKFPLYGLAREVAQSISLQDDSNLIDIQIPNDLFVDADRDELFRVFINLIRNAFEAGAKHITVTAEQNDNGTSIRIADDGPGLKPTARERLFQPFAGSTRKGGTGLGLTIARDLMRAHDGDIELLETSSKGTVFLLTLPAPRPSLDA